MKRMTQCFMMAACLFQMPAFADAQRDPKEVVQEYFADLQSGKIAELMNLFSDDVVWHQPGNNFLSGTYVGKEALAKLFGQFMQISAGSFKIDQVKSIMSNGNLVSATLHFSAHRCQYRNVEMSMDGVDLMKVVDGKIKEVYLFSEDQSKEDSFWGPNIEL